MKHSEKFHDVMKFILKWEGGYVNHPDDPGGETKYGISKRSYPTLDIKALTVEQAKDIYAWNYWAGVDGDNRPYPEALAVMDFAVHSGTSRALKFWEDAGGCLDSYVAARLDFLASLSTFPTFGRGWTRRMSDLTRTMGKARTTPDVELLQIYLGDGTFNFRPEKVTIGNTNAGRGKIMVRL